MGRTSCHVAMKVHLYGDKETQKEITDMLASHKDVFFSKVGISVCRWMCMLHGTAVVKRPRSTGDWESGLGGVGETPR